LVTTKLLRTDPTKLGAIRFLNADLGYRCWEFHIYWELIMYDFDLKKFFQVIYNHYEIDAGRKSLSSPDPGEICVPVQRRI